MWPKEQRDRTQTASALLCSITSLLFSGTEVSHHQWQTKCKEKASILCTGSGTPRNPVGFQPNTVFGQLKDVAFLQDCFVLGFKQLGKGFPGGSLVKNPPANAGDAGSIPGSGRFLGKGNGKPLQYSCLGNSMIRGAWRAAVHGVTKESDRLFSD